MSSTFSLEPLEQAIATYNKNNNNGLSHVRVKLEKTTLVVVGSLDLRPFASDLNLILHKFVSQHPKEIKKAKTFVLFVVSSPPFSISLSSHSPCCRLLSSLSFLLFID
jgi:hypothetical protein